STPYDVAIIGDYNIGGDAWSSRILLEEMGLRVIAQWSGDGTLIYDDVTGYEFERFVECMRPDLVGSGIKEKYVFQKMGVP
ncbi:nitrogenase molybdenum-iron protein alpha chain, partial [Paraburkholderia sp. BR10937]